MFSIRHSLGRLFLRAPMGVLSADRGNSSPSDTSGTKGANGLTISPPDDPPAAAAPGDDAWPWATATLSLEAIGADLEPRAGLF